MPLKSDILKFSKHKGKTWGELLDSEAGRDWLKWYVNTPSEGKYANSANKQKSEIREWLGEPKADTRTGSQVINMAFVLNKLEVLEKLMNVMCEKMGITNWEKEESAKQPEQRVQWEE